MIDTIVFDFGGVLCDWHALNHSQNLGLSDERRLQIKKIMFNGDEFYQLATGSVSQKDYEQALCKRYPEFADDLKKCFAKPATETMPENPEMVDLLIKLKKDGYHVHVLSDDTPESAELMLNSRFAPYVENFVRSTQTHIRKPNIKAFTNMLSIIKAPPETVLFIDDREENVNGAKSVGINTLLCKDIHQTCNKIKEIIYK